MSSPPFPGRVRVRPDEENLAQGDRFTPDSCPLSLALKRKGFRSATVENNGLAYLGLDHDGTLHVETFEIDPAGQQFVDDFDNGAYTNDEGLVIREAPSIVLKRRHTSESATGSVAGASTG